MCEYWALRSIQFAHPLDPKIPIRYRLDGSFEFRKTLRPDQNMGGLQIRHRGFDSHRRLLLSLGKRAVFRNGNRPLFLPSTPNGPHQTAPKNSIFGRRCLSKYSLPQMLLRALGQQHVENDSLKLLLYFWPIEILHHLVLMRFAAIHHSVVQRS